MLEEMYTDIKDQLPQIKEALSQGMTWGTELAGRYIQYDMVVQGLVTLLSVIILFLFYKLHKLAVKKEWYEDLDEMILAFLMAFSIMIIAGAFFVAFDSLSTIIKDIFIPEIRIIELLTNLTK